MVGLIAAAALLASASRAEAQEAQGNAFGLQLFRPAVDSKGYFTVNASPILGHLDFSIGLVATYNRYPFNLSSADGKNQLHVSDMVTPQWHAPLGLLQGIALGVAPPLHVACRPR